MEVLVTMRESDLTDEERKELFSRTLYSLIQQHGWSAADLARRSSMSRDNISRYLRGVSLPDDKRLGALARTLNVDPAELVPGSTLSSANGRSRNVGESFRIEPGTAAGLVWLRVNKQVPPSIAARIMEILAEEPTLHAANRS